MIPLPNLSVLEFAGNDARQFLHNQLSSDVNTLPEGAAGFSCCCNPAGRVIALMLLVPHAGSVFAVCSTVLAPSLEAWLARFIFRSKVTISRREDLVVCGWSEEVGDLRPVVASTVTGLEYALVDRGALKDAGQAQHVHWKSRELEAGICWLDEASTTQFLPQMLDFESIGALSFKKGCFPGQEIIARTRYLGTLKRRALKLRIADGGELAVLDKVKVNTIADSYSAVVVDSAASGVDESVLFLVIRCSEEIEPVSLSVGDQAFSLA